MATAGPLSCPNSNGTQYFAGGTAYNIYCGLDYFGNDIQRIKTDSLRQCLGSCSNKDGCISVAYVAESKKCYLKHNVNEGRAKQSVWGAVNAAVDETLNYPSCVNRKSDGTVYTLVSGAKYAITCGADSPQGDIKRETVTSFTECMSLCDNTQGCAGVAYAYNKLCWLKSSIKATLTSKADIWFAQKVVTTTTSTTLATSTTTANCLAPPATVCEGRSCDTNDDCCNGAYCGAVATGSGQCLQTKMPCATTSATTATITATEVDPATFTD